MSEPIKKSKSVIEDQSEPMGPVEDHPPLKLRRSELSMIMEQSEISEYPDYRKSAKTPKDLSA